MGYRQEREFCLTLVEELLQVEPPLTADHPAEFPTHKSFEQVWMLDDEDDLEDIELD